MASLVQNTRPQPAAQVQSNIRWLVSPRYDLGFFVLPGLLAFGFWGLYTLLLQLVHHLHPDGSADGMAVLGTYFLFTAFFDLPHIFQTFARTHADKTEFQRRKGLYTWGLPLILAIGPLLLWLGWDAWLIGFSALYGSYHIVRQHWGFVRLYQQLNEQHLNEAQRLKEQQIDRWCFQGAMLAFVLYDYVDLSDEPITKLTVFGHHYGFFPVFSPVLGKFLLGLGFLAVAVLIWRQLKLLERGERLNTPKLLLMGMALLVHFVLFVFAAVPFLVAEAIETIHHNFQYHALMGHYQRQRFPDVPHVVRKWLLASLCYGLIAGSLEVSGFVNGWIYPLFAPLSMLTLFHYYIDGKIWKFSTCPELRCLLPPPASSPQNTVPLNPDQGAL